MSDSGLYLLFFEKVEKTSRSAVVFWPERESEEGKEREKGIAFASVSAYLTNERKIKVARVY